MKEKIDYFIQYLTTITKDEADFILHVLNWDNDVKAAFKIAKQIFEETEEEDEE